MGIITVFDASGVPLTGASSIPASAITSGQVSTARGGTGQDLSASSGVLLLTAGTASALATTGSGNAVRATDPAVNMASGSLVLPATASALATTEGAAKWDTTLKQSVIYDGTRERTVSPVGFQPFAHPLNYVYTSAFSTALTLPANGGSVIMPVVLHASMLLQSITANNTDVATARTWGWDLYVDRNNGSNSVDRVASSSADETFTAAGQSNRTITAASAPVYLAPGVYWLVIQSRHATSSFGLASTAGAGTTNFTSIKTKTTSNPNGSTLDIIAATWSTSTSVAGVRLNGRVAANTVAW